MLLRCLKWKSTAGLASFLWKPNSTRSEKRKDHQHYPLNPLAFIITVTKFDWLSTGSIFSSIYLIGQFTRYSCALLLDSSTWMVSFLKDLEDFHSAKKLHFCTRRLHFDPFSYSWDQLITGFRVIQFVQHHTKGLTRRTMAVYVRYKSFYISLPFSAKKQREMTKYCVFWRARATAAIHFVFSFNK